ncbi:hypothetical protein [Jannaschia sp. M317]|uniref:hypothetical protein n=1 Tax=Jannaschia sp. M317 TaxID=2867011 RepID=UPI0021A6BDF8|nr:hypothetical protein [Jannaschia sp. M317]UWQ19768.1 hypothetical protein K3551_18480 [Jannaschia sp. M317]
MAWKRPITLLLAAALLWTGLLGASGMLHAHENVHVESQSYAEFAQEAVECCQDVTDRSPSCISISAVVVEHSVPIVLREFHSTFLVGPPGLPAGRDPHEFLDPPRVI